jgi:hypothetical protein
MEFHGEKKKKNSMEVHRLSIEFHGGPWTYMDLRGPPWNFHGLPWTFMEFPWTSVDLHGLPWTSTDFPWNSI